MDTKLYRTNLFSILTAAANGDKDAMTEARAVFAEERENLHREWRKENNKRSTSHCGNYVMGTPGG